jgi:hypothetical protein
MPPKLSRQAFFGMTSSGSGNELKQKFNPLFVIFDEGEIYPNPNQFPRTHSVA